MLNDDKSNPLTQNTSLANSDLQSRVLASRANMQKQFLTLEQVATILKVSYARAAELARLNLLPVVRLGRVVRVDPDQLADFIAQGGRPLAGGWRRNAE